MANNDDAMTIAIEQEEMGAKALTSPNVWAFGGEDFAFLNLVNELARTRSLWSPRRNPTHRFAAASDGTALRIDNVTVSMVSKSATL